MNQSCFSLGFLSQNSLWKLSTFHGYESIYSKVWDGAKHGALASHSRLGWVASSSRQITERPDCIFFLVVIQLSWPFNFLHTSHVCYILASHYLRVNQESILVAHYWSNLHTLSHTALTLFPSKYRISKCRITSKFDTEYNQHIVE